MVRIPILKMGQCLILTIQGDLTDSAALALQDDLTAAVSRTGARGVLIDISGLPVVDSFIARSLGDLAAMSRLLDADTVVVGMQPAVAMTLVELGIQLRGIRTALNAEQGMAILAGSAGDGSRS